MAGPATTPEGKGCPVSRTAVVRRALLSLSVLAALAALSALAGDGAHEARAEESEATTAPFETVFAEADRIVLEEPDSALISKVRHLSIGPRGRIAVPDQELDRVRVYGPDGSLLADLGGEGAGPGEFRGPRDAAFTSDGRLWVSDAGNGRLARFGPGLSFERTFSLEDAYYAGEIEALGDRIVAFLARPTPGALALRVYDGEGAVLRTFHPRRRAYREVPYWSAVLGHRLAVSESHLVAGGNLLYPLARYGPDGALRDSVGRPPASWEPAPEPERGDFAGPDRFRKLAKWRRTFTTIDRVALYRDSLLVVSHRSLDPEVLAYEEATYRADVYRTDGTKLLEDVELPGRLLAGGEHLHLLRSTPPGPWAVGRYELAPDRRVRVAMAEAGR